MATGSDIVTDAMYACGALGSADTLDADDAALALRRLNRMLDSWNNLRLSIFEEFKDTLPTVAGTQSYLSSLLAGAARPVRVTAMYVTDGTIDYQLELLNAQQWANIPLKATRSRPAQCWVEPSMPASTFYLYPVPDKVYTLNVVQYRPLPTTLTLATTLALPPGYEKALSDCLAVDIAPSFGRSVTPDMARAASAAERSLHIANVRVPVMDGGFGAFSDATNTAILFG